jgi:hypothetical protein
MARVLAPVGMIALFFAVGAFYTSDHLGAFGWANLLGGSAALLIAAVSALRDARAFGSAAGRRAMLPRVAGVVVAFALAFGLEQAAARSNLRFDATAERRYTLAPATLQALASSPGEITATLYYDPLDTRLRSTRLLLETLAQAGPLRVRERDLHEAAREAAEHEVAASNTVVLQLGGRYETVDRPTEGSLFEALELLMRDEGSEEVIYIARGAGEGDFTSSEPTGYSGLAHALQAEGYRLKDLVTAAVDAIPEDADVVLLVAPRRGLREPFLAALDAFLRRGGGLLAMLEPGADTGLEELLERWGFELPDAVVVDPASGPVEGDPPGVNPVVFQYADHPVTRGLNASRMIFFRHTRPVHAVHKPEPDDDLRDLVFTSRRAWLATNVRAVMQGLAPERPPGEEGQYWSLAAAGRYPRGSGEARIVVIGSAELASNHYLRALYNLDLVMNAVHWVADREPAITLRPKALAPNQFPMTPQDSLRMFYGVGLSVPELCLIAAAVFWIRRRSG